MEQLLVLKRRTNMKNILD